jgi:2-polyprenyl-3-methyl-5-hydroxy-6-metoxy-1,4-benzoquinol methylase
MSMLLNTDKPTGYYSNMRRELIDEVPIGPHEVLEVGCGEGRVGAAIKAEGRASYVTGIELTEDAAKKAKNVLDRVLVGDVEKMDLPFTKGQFDVIVLGDVMEHLVDPWSKLGCLVTYLKPGGAVVASLPNIRNWRTLFSLIFLGKWEYKDLGVMDITHLRFFTRSGMIKLFRDSGLEIKKMVPLGHEILSRLPIGFLREFATQQYLLVGIRKEG